MRIKYKYKVFSLLDSYPTEEDILFEIVSSLQERSKIEDEWSYATIKNVFSKKIEESEISLFLDELVKKGFLSERDGTGKRGKLYKIEQIPDTLK